MKNKVIKVKGDKKLIALINNGVVYDREIKRLQGLLSSTKEDLDGYAPGKYMTPGGNVVTISQSPKYTPIDPGRAKQALRTKRLGKNFMGCITIGVTKLSRFLSDQEIGTLRTVSGYIRKYSFK